MNDILFYKSFGFKNILIKGYGHTDNSKGIDCHFFARMKRGRGHIITENKDEMFLEAGDVFYLPLGLRCHSYWYGDNETDNKAEWESYGFTVLPDNTSKKYKMQKIDADDKAIEILDRLAESMEITPLSVGLLYLFCSRVLPQMNESGNDTKKALYLKVKDYISENPEFKVPELAKHCGMSESGIYAFLRSYAHTTPIELKNRLKTNAAKALLECTNLSVEEISSRLGFSTSAYFRKVMKEQTGKTPTEIRKEAKLM